MTKLDQLPSELLSLILSYIPRWYLPSCALINKSFHREAMPLLWHKVDIWCEKKYIAFITGLMQSPHAPGHHVRSLSILNILDSDPNASDLEQDVPNLDSLGDNIIVSLQHIPRYCPQLTELDIRCHKPIPGAHWIIHAMIAAVGQSCPQLTTLFLHRFPNLNYDDLFVALKDVPLTDIWLILPHQLDRETLQRFLKTAPLALHLYQQLTTLIIETNDDNTSFINTINTHGLTWPHLTTFTLEGCYSLTDAMALTFVQTNPTIERLNLDCSGISDAFLDGLVDYLPNLTMLSLECTAMTAPGICRLITNYDGRLDGVDCEGCGIYPENVPNDKTYHYSRMWDEGEYFDVGWFDGTFS